MRPFRFFGPLALAALARAQYFSAGWSPGQSVQKDAASTATSYAPDASHTSTPASSSGSIFDMKNILSSGPVSSLLSRIGVNITQRLDQDKPQWDHRIPLITDQNYADMIANEAMTSQEEKDRMWFLVITVTSSQSEGVSKVLDDIFDTAYNTSMIEGDLPNVRWGRIDYLNVTTITTKWAIWQAPYLVFVTDRGQTLRFVKGSRLRLHVDAMREFLKQGDWKTLEPWSSAYSPGGSREWVLDYLAFVLTKIYNVIVRIPKWAMFILTGGLGSVVIKLLHKNPAAANKVTVKEPVQTPAKPDPIETPASPAQLPAPKRTGTRQRKAAKK